MSGNFQGSEDQRPITNTILFMICKKNLMFILFVQVMLQKSILRMVSKNSNYYVILVRCLFSVKCIELLFPKVLQQEYLILKGANMNKLPLQKPKKIINLSSNPILIHNKCEDPMEWAVVSKYLLQSFSTDSYTSYA